MSTPHSILQCLAAPLALVVLTQAPTEANATALPGGTLLPLLAASPPTKAAETNRIDGLSVEELDDGTTVLRVTGSRKPTFNVYRLSSPERLVVDIAGSEPGKVVPHVPLDTWACGRVTVDGVSERDASLVRLVVELKRDASYIVLPKGDELVITVTPRQVAPEAYFARKSANERRADIEKSNRDAKALQAEARALSSHAHKQAKVADRKVAEAESRADAARQAEVRAKAAERRATDLEGLARKTLADAKSRKVKLRRELRQAEDARSKAEEARAAAESQRRAAESALVLARRDLEAERSELKAARGEVEAARGEVEAELAKARTKTERAEQNAAKLVEQAKVELAQARSSAEAANRKAKAELAKAEKDAARAAKAARRADAAAKQKLDEAAAKADRQLQRARADVAKSEAAVASKLAAAQKAEKRAELLLMEARAKATHEAERTMAHARKEAEREAKKKLAAAEKAEADARRKAAALLASAEAEAQAKIDAATKAARRKAQKRLAQAEAEAERRLAEAKKKAQTHAVAKAERELGELRKKAEGEVAREVARAKTKAEREASSDLAQARVRAEKVEARAQAKLTAAEATLAKAEADASAKKKSAAALEGRARDALARAERALSQAKSERDAAAAARREADARLAATERRVRKAKRRGKASAELERSLAAAKKASAQAQGRLTSVQRDIKKLSGDRDALERTLAHQRKASKALASKIEARSQELERLEHKVAKARKAGQGGQDRLRREQKALASEGASLRKRNAAAKAELDRAEAELVALRKSITREQNKLSDAEQAVEQAQEKLESRVAKREASAGAAAPAKVAPKASNPPPGDGAFIRDVRFEDDGTESRVIVELEGPVRFQGKTLTPDIQLLALEGARIDSRLERSLDARAYGGPVQRITSFSEDGGAKVIVATAGNTKPRIEQGDGVLVWHFPHGREAARPPAHEVASLPGTKVGGYAAAVPPVAAARTAAMAPASSSSTLGQSRSGSSSSAPVRGTRWRGERIDIELQDAPIKDVLLLFSDIGRVNIIAGTGVEGSVTMKLTAVPWDQALDIILRSLNLGMVREGNVIRVATSEALETERREAIERANARVQLKPLQTRLVSVSYATADEMVPKVQSVLSPRGSVTPDARTNKLIIMDVAENIALAEQLVSSLDTQTPQILIEARIVEARTNFQRQLGIQWGFDFTASPGTGNPTGLLFPNSAGIGGGATGTPVDSRGLVLPAAAANPNYVVDLPAPVGTGAGGALGFSFGSISGNLNTNLRLSQAEETGEVRIISSPKIVALDNIEAQIEDGVQIPISQVSAQGVNTRFVNASLSLRVTPHVTNEGAVLLDVQVQKNEADFVNTGARGDPTILTKQAQTRMLVNDSDTAVIGGIYSRNKAVNFTKVPWLADIPLIGWFFKNKNEADTRSEVLIFLTPKIVNRASSIGG
ncbi:MAG: type IV pilus secretin PilQ [Myxococcota bacterium]